MDAPVVSVLVPTYRHAAYLETAVQSALAQKAEFPFEILIGDDASDDGTSEIAMRLSTEHPDVVRAFVSSTNEGGHVNFNRLYGEARGRFIALLEGDDLWTDSTKLARQAQALQNEPGVALCFHDMRIQYEGQPERAGEQSGKGDPELTTLERLSRFNYIRTSSVVFRNGLIAGLPDWVLPLPLGDWPLFLLIAQHGDLRRLPETMGIYRVHAGGVWGRRGRLYQLQQTIRVAEACRKNLGHPGFNDCVYKCSRTLAQLAWRRRRPGLLARSCVKMLSARLRGGVRMPKR